MDYYNFSSKMTEPLELLHPPVSHRGFRSARREWACPVCSAQGNSTHRKDCPRSLARPSGPVFEKGNSSTSLILKKTTEREIHGRYSVLSYTNLQYSSHYNRSAPSQGHKERSVIRVSVIPNNNGSNKPRKRRSLIKKVQSTLSNQESSIKAKNVFLVIKGRKREKAYEIQTTGSVEFQSNQRSKVENVAVEENLKGILESLNMDKKKKKAKKKVVEPEDDEYEIYKRGSNTSLINDILQDPISVRDEHEIFMPGCYCPPKDRKRTSNDSRDLKSRVKIFGRLGLGEDDKYVLNCNATVDDKPIETNIQGNINGKPLERENRMLRQEHQPRKRGQRDFIVQADMGNNVGPISVEFSTSVATQCSPANFNSVCFSNIEKLQITSNPNQTIHWKNPTQTLHCKCNANQNITANISDYDSGSQTPHSCQSPLVIISVYPKHGTVEKEHDQNTDHNKFFKEAKSNSPPQKPNSGTVSPVQRGPKTKQKADNEKQQNKRESRSPESSGTPRSPRTRSPSPSPGSTSPGRNPPKPKHEANQDMKGPKQKHNEAKQDLKGPKQKPNEAKQDLKGPKQKPNKGSPGTPRSSSNLNKKQQQKDKSTREISPKASKMSPNASRPGPSKQANKDKENQNKKELSDPVLTKKAIVDAYTKKVTAQMRQGKAGDEAQGINSNVTVNIEGESEYYNVIFQQGKRTTDLRVRKTMKNQASQKSYADVDGAGSASLENLFYMTDVDQDRKWSFDLANDGEFEQDASRMKAIVRDSIEISHRREFNSGSKLNVLNSSEMSFTDPTQSNPEFYAPVKHFKGDNCALPNPVERDKEIRQLLGVENRRPSFSRQADAGKEAFDIKNDSKSLRCFFRAGETKRVSNIQESVIKSYRVKCEPGDKDCIPSEDELTPTESDDHNIRSTDYQCAPCPGPPRQDYDDSFGPGRRQSFASRDEEYEMNGAPLYQQLILNRNVNVYLQIEQFTKEKPIVLTRDQYDKVKRTIESANFKRPGLKITKKPPYGSVAQMQGRFSQRNKERGECCSCDSSSESDYGRRNDIDCECGTKRSGRKSNHDCECDGGRRSKGKNKKESKDRVKKKSKHRTKPIQKCCRNCGAIQLASCCPQCGRMDLVTCKHCGRQTCVPPQPCSSRPSCVSLPVCSSPPSCATRSLCSSQPSCPKPPCAHQPPCAPKPSCAHLLPCAPKPPGAHPTPCAHQPPCVPKPPCTPQPQCAIQRQCANEYTCYYCGFRYNTSVKKDKPEKPASGSYILETTVPGPEPHEETNVAGPEPHAVPSTEIHYTNISYVKHVKFSSTKIEDFEEMEQIIAQVQTVPMPEPSKLLEKDSPSIHTIYKGHRKSPTPNLGTSEFSLYSDYSDAQSSKEPEVEKPRKPFLKRLMSCLVMHSRPSQARVFEKPRLNLRTVNSSIDSYHFSTSIGAVDISSSIYDTSASYYSNHSVYPINSKQTMKRGFLNSVRGFLYRA